MVLFAEFKEDQVSAFAGSTTQFVAAHLRVDANGSVKPVFVTAGDLGQTYGRIMYSTFTSVNAVVSLPGTPEPRLEGTMLVTLNFLQTYSTLDGIAFDTHQTIARIDFSVSAIND